MPYTTNLKKHEQECRDRNGDSRNTRNGGYEYWQLYYLTGPRKYAKDCTNSVIRAFYRNLLNTHDPDELDDAQALSGSDYEKMFDYNWTIW